jgi:hypothetical protein
MQPVQNTSLRRSAATALAALVLSAAPSAEAAVQTLWATSVPETSSPASTTPWTNEGYAAGAPPCFDCNNTSCQYATNSVNGNTTPLTAVDFQNFSLSACRQVWSVRVEVSCRYNTNTSAGIEFRAFAPNHGIDSGWRSVPNFSSNTNCGDRLGGVGDITSLRPSWTAAQINDLRVQVRRKGNVTNNTLRVVGIKLMVDTGYVDPPAAPANLQVTGRTASTIHLAWGDAANNEIGYRVYRWPTAQPYSPVISEFPPNTTTCALTGLAAGTAYSILVEAMNPCDNEEDQGVAFIETATTSGHPWINELHLQGATDFVEVAAPMGTPISEYMIYSYLLAPGTSVGTVFNIESLWSLGNATGGIGFQLRWMANHPSTALGFALVHMPTGQVVEFISHNCTMVAVNGPAAGRVSAPIPYTLNGQPLERSLSRRGMGCTAANFSWGSPADGAGIHSLGMVNIGQTIAPVP